GWPATTGSPRCGPTCWSGRATTPARSPPTGRRPGRRRACPSSATCWPGPAGWRRRSARDDVRVGVGQQGLAVVLEHEAGLDGGVGRLLPCRQVVLGRGVQIGQALGRQPGGYRKRTRL